MKYTVKRVKLSNADLKPWKVLANGKIAASMEYKHQAEYVASKWNATSTIDEANDRTKKLDEAIEAFAAARHEHIEALNSGADEEVTDRLEKVRLARKADCAKIYYGEAA
jgi:hypothetical protein